MSISSLNNDVFNVILSWLPTDSLCVFGRVCKPWKAIADQPAIWENHSTQQNIPVVKGENRNYKSDFRVLREITVGFNQLEPIFGQCIGMMPKIARGVFDFLQQPDKFEPRKTIGQTCVFVVVPKAFKKAFEEGLLLDLFVSGDGFKDVDLEKAMILKDDMEIPCSNKNIFVLDRKKHFNFPDFTKCNSVADDVHIYLMRKMAPAQTCNLICEAQETLLKQNGFEMIVPLQVAMLAKSVEFAETKKCSSIDTRTSDVFDGNFGKCNVVIGFLEEKGRLRVDAMQCHQGAHGAQLGAVPCIRADAEKE